MYIYALHISVRDNYNVHDDVLRFRAHWFWTGGLCSTRNLVIGCRIIAVGIIFTQLYPNLDMEGNFENPNLVQGILLIQRLSMYSFLFFQNLLNHLIKAISYCLLALASRPQTYSMSLFQRKYVSLFFF